MRKKLLLIAILVVLIAVAAVGAYSAKHKKSGSSTVNTKDSSLYYDRPGFDRQTIGMTVGDPAALKLTAKDGAQELASGAKIIPACAIITQKDITGQGLLLFPNGFGYPVQQNYLDKSGQAPFAPNTLSMPTGSDTLSCSYGLYTPGQTNKSLENSLSIDVVQPFIATESVVADNTTRFAKQADMNGYQVYKKESEISGTIYRLRKDGATVDLTMEFKDSSKKEKFLKTAITNLDSFSTKPKGITTASYDTPTFTKSFAKACDLVDNDDMKQLSGVDASPLVREFWPTATGEADFSALSDYKTASNYLRSQCIRTSNTPDYKTLTGTTNHTLQVTTTSYESTEAATNGLQYLSITKDNDKVKTAGIGDEAYAYKSAKEHQNTLAFRKGRVVVELVYDYAFQDRDAKVSDLTSYTQKLTPIAQKMVPKLQDFAK
jgi:hypothetical protein